MAANRCRDAGFALIIVLWTLVLLAFIATQIVGSARVESRIAGNLVANAVADAAADGAVYQAIFQLMDPNQETRWPLDDSVRTLDIGHCRVSVRLSDEAARINPNLAPRALLAALLQVTGSDAGSARRLAAAIGEWVGGAQSAHSADAATEEYRGAGLDYAPPGEPLETLGELRRVLGMTPGVFAAIRPHLSLFAPAEPSLAHADPLVAAAMGSLAGSAQAPARTPPLQFETLTARIAAAAQCPDKARVTRSAVAQIVPRGARYAVLVWNPDGEGEDEVARQAAARSSNAGSPTRLGARD